MISYGQQIKNRDKRLNLSEHFDNIIRNPNIHSQPDSINIIHILYQVDNALYDLISVN